ncbi:MAG: helix-turn-helix transcriptional regulator [Acidobacteria bacterium]|nr:helix-turn-helix transcriptional regulator [Acidobacteriota bacterium]
MHYQEKREPKAVKISDFISQRQFHRLGLYNEFFRQLSVEHQIAFILPAPPPLVIGIAVNRAHRDFSECDRLFLNLLSPHLIQAYRNAEAVTQMQGQLALVQHTLEKLDQGVIVLTRDGRVTLANAQAIQWLTDYFGSRSVLGNSLPENLQRWLSHQEALLDAKDDLPPPQKPLVVEREAKRLVVRHLCEPAQCVLLFDEQQTALSPQAFELLGLSQREAEVLLWVAQGKTNIELGIILGLSPRTVQKHLERIFQKLGVENRTAAAAMAHEIASGFTRN